MLILTFLSMLLMKNGMWIDNAIYLSDNQQKGTMKNGVCV